MGGCPIYAIVRTGGKQYRVEPGQRLRVERLDAEPGQQVELPEVLLLSAEGEVRLGSPTLPDTKVVAEVVEQRRGPKLIVFKYKAKTRYRRKRGHRQSLTELLVRQIVTPEGVVGLAPPPQTEAKPRRRRPSAASAAAAAEATVAEVAPEAGARPSRRRERKAEAAAEVAAPVEPEGEPRPRRRRAQREPAGE